MLFFINFALYEAQGIWCEYIKCGPINAIVVHRFYDRVMLSREVDSMSAADQAAVSGISIEALEALILPLLFGDNLRLTVD